MISAEFFHSGLPYDEFLQQHGSETDRNKWQAALDAISLSEDQKRLLSGFTREMRVLVFAGAWCGDCVSQCPILRQFEICSDKIQLRFMDRDANPTLRDSMGLCGAPRVPQTVIFSEEDFFVSRHADKTLARYRKIVESMAGEVCSSGILIGNDPVQQAIVQDWLDEFEHAQLMLRTSSRLRQKHGD